MGTKQVTAVTRATSEQNSGIRRYVDGSVVPDFRNGGDPVKKPKKSKVPGVPGKKPKTPMY